jgi:hypothetical protein
MSRSFVRALVLGVGAGALLAGIAVSARADDDHWRQRHDEHKWHQWCRHHPGAYAYPGYYCSPAVVVAPPPAVVIAPPPPAVVVAPPAPVVVAPLPSVNVVVPIHIR